MQANVTHLGAESLIIAVKVMSWLENLNASVRQPVIGLQRRSQHVCVSKFKANLTANTFESVLDLCNVSSI